MDITGAGIGCEAYYIGEEQDSKGEGLSLHSSRIAAGVSALGFASPSSFRLRAFRSVLNREENIKLIARLFFTWKSAVKDKRNTREKVVYFIGRKWDRLAKNSFSQWVQFRSHAREERLKLLRYILRREKGLLGNSFSKWAVNVREKKLLQIIEGQKELLATAVAKRDSLSRPLQGVSIDPVQVRDKPKTVDMQGGNKKSSLKGRVQVVSRFSTVFSQVYSLNRFDKGFVFLRVAAWVATIALAFIPLLTLYLSCEIVDCLNKKS